MFREVLAGPTWLRIVGVLVLVAAVLLAADAVIVEPSRFVGGGLIAAVAGVVVLLALGVLVLMVRSTVEVTDTTLRLGLYPLWRRSFPRAELAAPRQRDLTVREFGGLGYRVLPGNRRGLLLSSGTGVEFRVTGADPSLLYAVRSDRPAELARALLRP